MIINTQDLAHILLALALLLTAAHGIGHVFAHLRQPRVIGEIVGGLVLGPTVFGTLAPELQRQVFPAQGPTASVLGAVYQLGLLLLMFCSGAEIRSGLSRREGKTVTFITVSGTILPFLAGLAFVLLFSTEALQGAASNPTSFTLVFASAIAVTSIPVISRIMFDLGVLETSFARIVLAAAVIEDILLYVVLTIALGLAHAGQEEEFGLPALLRLDGGSGSSTAYHVAVTVLFLGLFLWLGSRVFQRSLGLRYNVLHRSNPIAFQLVVLLVVSLMCVFLGVVPLFGAFVAGMIAVSERKNPTRARESIKSFSFAFFIPIYFGIVGLRLDLVRSFSLRFFLLFLVFACAAKLFSVYAGGRLAGERQSTGINLAVAMNARGGPGIVLASAALDARIITELFYSALVMLAIVTSMLAGSWLGRVIRTGQPLRETSQHHSGRAAKSEAENAG
jgi:Kef-type K+ transport system membrane component KefB